MSTIQKTWQIQYQLPIAQENRVGSILKGLLENRGLKKISDQELFFSPIHPKELSLKDLGIPKKEIDTVLIRLEQAKTNQETIIIYGDYDADGITSTAVLWEALYSLGFQVKPFLPHRENHGYGLKAKGIDSLIKEMDKPDLLITVDNGIVAFEGAKYCQQQGIDLIISDHHEPGETYPEALAIIHSTQTSGSGVAFFLAKELLKHFKGSLSVDHLLEAAAIGVIADVVPLTGISRSLAKYGLLQLPKTQRPGLQALLSQAGLTQSTTFSTYHVGFIIAPRLNATGRLEHCMDSLRLLCTPNPQRAMQLAVNLGSVNKLRQDLTADSLAKVIATIEPLIQKQKIIITSSAEYNPGVIGLIAGKLTEKFYRPTIAMAILGDVAKGSVRSIPGVNIIQMLRTFEEDFLELGGHPMAAGFSLAVSKIPLLQQKLEALAFDTISSQQLIPSLTVETELALGDLSIPLYQAMEAFQPFGMGNPHPVFVSRNLEVSAVIPMGKAGNHLKLWVKEKREPSTENRKSDTDNTYKGNRHPAPGTNPLEAVLFNAGEWVDMIKTGDVIDLAYQLDLNEWNGQTSLQLMIKDIKVT